MGKKLKILLLALLNIVLIAFILILLSSYGVIQLKSPLTTKSVSSLPSEDAFLVEKESLRKQWEVLSAKENYLSEKMQDMDSEHKLLQENLREAKKQTQIAKDMQKAQKQQADAAISDEASTRSLADKITGVPPQDGANMLNDMDATSAVDVIRMMDKIAKENGKQSTSAYLISLMQPAKRKEVVRLLAQYPSAIKSLNDDETPPPSPTP